MRLPGFIKELPPVLGLRHAYYRRRFEANRLLHYGVYRSFEEASAAIPRGSVVGWNTVESIANPGISGDRVNPRDYPVLFWMRTLWSGEVSVLDFGGHLGQKRRAYAKYLDFDATKDWIVCDVPEMIAAGEKAAAECATRNLSFTTDFRRAADCTLLLCLGVLQFIEEPLGEKLRALSRRPPHLIINDLPLHDDRSFVTLEHVGNRFSPYRISKRSDFIASIEGAGYDLVDRWENAEKSFWLPIVQGYSVERYSGLYFRRAT